MKRIDAILKKSACLTLCCSLLTSCYSYKPYIDDVQITSEILQEKITPGKKYEIMTIDGKRLTVKVDSTGNRSITGDVSWIVSYRQSKNDHSASQISETVHQKNYTILFEQIKSVRERKVSAGKTIAAIVVPIGILALIGTYSLNNMYSSGW